MKRSHVLAAALGILVPLFSDADRQAKERTVSAARAEGEEKARAVLIGSGGPLWGTRPR